jgi:cytochrome c oxidase subunit 3
MAFDRRGPEPVEGPPFGGAKVIPITRAVGIPRLADVGMALFLFSWGLSFVGLAVAYLVVWSRALSWPPPGTPPRPIVFPIVNTVFALASTVTYDLAVRSARLNRGAAVRRYLSFTGGFATLFLILQSIMWLRLRASGFRLGVNNYVGLFYALTGFHALHVVAGVGMLAVLMWRNHRKMFSAMDNTTLRLAGWFWHFVTGAWIGVFLLLWAL